MQNNQILQSELTTGDLLSKLLDAPLGDLPASGLIPLGLIDKVVDSRGTALVPDAVTGSVIVQPSLILALGEGTVDFSSELLLGGDESASIHVQ